MCIFSKPLSFGYIYCISNDTLNECYIGSTFNYNKRKRNHKDACNGKRSNVKVYKFIRENGEWKNWRMDILEEIVVSSKRQLELYEDKCILFHKPLLNSNRARRTAKQYYEDKREEIIDKVKANQKKNAKYLFEKRRVQTECECGGKYTYAHKAEHFKSPRHNKYKYEGVVYVPKTKNKK